MQHLTTDEFERLKDQLFDATDAAQYLGIHDTTFYEKANRGHFPRAEFVYRAPHGYPKQYWSGETIELIGACYSRRCSVAAFKQRYKEAVAEREAEKRHMALLAAQHDDQRQQGKTNGAASPISPAQHVLELSPRVTVPDNLEIQTFKFARLGDGYLVLDDNHTITDVLAGENQLYLWIKGRHEKAATDNVGQR